VNQAWICNAICNGGRKTDCNRRTLRDETVKPHTAFK
jgi:hypothetical protein